MNAQEHQSQVVWVRGKCGCGKTALVTKTLEEAIREEGTNKGYFVRGRYDEMRSAQPFNGLMDALSDLCDYILKDGQIGLLRIKLANALGSDVAVLASALPSLTKIIGESAPSSSAKTNCKPEWKFARLKVAIRVFLQTICKCNIPVALFLEDLHYADEDSLELVKSITIDEATTSKSLVIVGSWSVELKPEPKERSNGLFEVIVQHIANNPKTVTLIKVDNLELDAVKTLLSSVSNEQMSNSDELANFLYEKTSGNPNFLVLLLRPLLLDNGFRRAIPSSLELPGTPNWEWDMALIKRTCIHDTPLDLISNQVNMQLADGVREVLTICACIGSHFTLKAVDMIVNTRTRHLDVVGALQEAVNAGILLEDPIRGYRFISDDLRRMVYLQVPEESDRAVLHLSIGYQLNGRLEVEKELDPCIVFLVSHQLNMGAEMVTETKGRFEIAKSNVRAAKVAKEKAAFTHALDCLQQSWDLISREHNKWDQDYRLSVEVAKLFMEILYAKKDYTTCLFWVNELLRHSLALEDKLQAFLFKVKARAAQDMIAGALGAALESLEELGEKLAVNPPQWQIKKELATTRLVLRSKRDETLVALPMTSREKPALIIALLWCVVDFCKSSAVLNHNLLELAAVRQMKIALREGQVTGYSLSVFGRVLGNHRFIVDACRFADLSLRRMDLSDPSDRVPTLTSTMLFLSHLQRPWHACIDPLLEARRIGLSCGEAHFGSLAALSAIEIAIYAGIPLRNIQQRIETTQHDIETFGRKDTMDRFSICKQYVLNLAGECFNPLILSGSAMDEETFLENARGPPLHHFHLVKLQLAVYFQDETGMEYSSNAMLQEGISLEDTHITSIPRLFFLGLAACRLGRIRGDRQYHGRARRITKELEKLSTAAKKVDDVCAIHHILVLLRAELASSRPPSRYNVKQDYDDAIEASAKNGFINHVALSNELAGEYFQSKQDSNMAKYYFTKSDEQYHAWGANAKVRTLTQEAEE